MTELYTEIANKVFEKMDPNLTKLIDELEENLKNYRTAIEDLYEDGDTIHLIEAKHSKRTELPSRSDILDAFFKMILYTNLDNIVCNGITYRPQPVLKMTSSVCSSVENLSDQNKKLIELYKKEATTQNSHIMISFNNRYLQ